MAYGIFKDGTNHPLMVFSTEEECNMYKLIACEDVSCSVSEMDDSSISKMKERFKDLHGMEWMGYHYEITKNESSVDLFLDNSKLKDSFKSDSEPTSWQSVFYDNEVSLNIEQYYIASQPSIEHQYGENKKVRTADDLKWRGRQIEV
tara:strand:- start:404 stop:844 length:441 start_codon:yes stop_codon:yes gene_type:complete